MRRRAATAAVGGALVILGIGVSSAVGNGGRPLPPDGAAQALLGADVGPLKSSEARLGSAEVADAYSFGAERVVVARAVDGRGGPRTVFARMSYEPDLQQWYPAESLDRPSAGGFSWAQLTLGNGQQVLVWDRLPNGRHLLVSGDEVSSEPSGALVWDEPIDQGEVEIR